MIPSVEYITVTVQRIHEVVVRRALIALGAPYIIPLTLLMASEQ